MQSVAPIWASEFRSKVLAKPSRVLDHYVRDHLYALTIKPEIVHVKRKRITDVFYVFIRPWILSLTLPFIKKVKYGLLSDPRITEMTTVLEVNLDKDKQICMIYSLRYRTEGKVKAELIFRAKKI